MGPFEVRSFVFESLPTGAGNLLRTGPSRLAAAHVISAQGCAFLALASRVVVDGAFPAVLQDSGLCVPKGPSTTIAHT